MKYKFIKSHFTLYFCTFTIPVMFLSLILLVQSYRSTALEVNENLDRAAELGTEQLNHYVSLGKALNMYIENGNQGVYFYQILRNPTMDYSAVISMRHLSSYLTSIKTTNNHVNSVYYYIKNPLGRVLTSDPMITTLDEMKDTSWTGEFDRISAGGWKAVPGKAKRWEFEGELEVYRFFFRFLHYDGGTVINYEKRQVQNFLDEVLSYEDQFFMVCRGDEVLMSNRDLLKRPEMESGYLTETRNLDGYQVITGVPRTRVSSLIALNIKAILLMILISVASAAALAYYCAIRNYRHLHEIVTIFDVASEDRKPAEEREESKTLYTQILNNIIHTFVENHYLQAQLSKRKYKQMAAQLIALQCQINPHFLFNTLQAINYEVMDVTKGRYSRANSMIEHLADILRYSLADPEEPVTLEKEVEHCKKYLEIQRLRQNQPFHAEWEVPESVVLTRVPRLILQPLVENAITHGIRGLDHRKIRIQIRARERYVRFVIGDNGVGISKERLAEIRETLECDTEEITKDHIGLYNTNMRLRLLYGKDSSVTIGSKIGMGTVVSFQIPVRI